ncbi:MAG: phosphoribosylformylglycinamidine synthase, partial [Alphaproteobacteria bacterium]|nr:phosphoribosylformylglycinamidine synthase [Alphaproteobacteria bacterium]
MHTRIEILAHKDDGRARKIEKMLYAMGIDSNVRAVDVYTSESPDADNLDFANALANPVTQKVNQTPRDFNWALEIGFLPGVTDNIGNTASEILELIAPPKEGEDQSCYSSRLYLIKGDVTREQVDELASSLSNKLIQRISIKSKEEYDADGGMDVVIPKVNLDNKGAVADSVNLNISDKDLEVIGKSGIANQDDSRRGPLGLSLLYMQAIQDYFKKQGRHPTDIEIETL